MKPFPFLLSNRIRVRPEWCVALLLCLSSHLVGAQVVVTHAQVERELRQANYDKVLSLTQQALNSQPRDPKMMFWQALSQEKLGRTEQALALYVTLTQDHPELPEPHNNLGVVLMRRGDLEGAQLAFQEALRMDAKYAQAMENLADVLLIQSKRLYQQALPLSPTKERLTQKIRAVPDFRQP